MLVTISRIQHRMGLQEDIPQLAAGELGWSIDERRLFIGNGAVEDGAPPAYVDPNNTEIITEHSIAALIGSFPLYQYEGNGTITLITGPNALNPVFRTIQDRLDDYVSVKAFGALGDGITDDTNAINRALYELYVHDNTNFNKKILFFPAGNYQIFGTKIKVPTNASIMGEGINRTIITQTDNSVDCVLYIADSLQQTDVGIGTNGASYPGNNHISHLTLQRSYRIEDIVSMDIASNVTFDNVKFQNNWNTGDGGASGAQAVSIRSNYGSSKTTSIKFNNCEFVGNEYINKLDYDVVDILFNNCKFYMNYSVASLGQGLTGLGNQIRGPYGYKIVNSYFDKIYFSAIKTFANVISVLSANNYFYDVGGSNVGALNYDYPIISFTSAGNLSIGDYSERPDTNEGVKQVQLLGSGSIEISANNGISLNRWQSSISLTVPLPDNTTVATTTGIVKSYLYVPAMKINYRISRDNNIRFGELMVTASVGGLSITDSFEESGAAIGVTFSVASLGGANYEVRYQTSGTGFNATAEFQINSMR